MKKAVLIILGLLLVCCLVSCVVIFSLAGKVPGISDQLLSQKDLGVSGDPELIYDFYDEIDFKYTIESSQPQEGDLKYSGELAVERAFSQAEANAWISAWEKDWADMPFTNPQFVVNADGSMEGSAMVSIDKAIKFAEELGYSQEQIDEARSRVSFLDDDLPLYVKANGEIVNNELTLDVTELEVAGFGVPSSIASAVESLLSDFYPRIQEQAPTLDIKELKPSEGKMVFKGTIPAKVEIE